jgi:hypothetical protein
MEPYFPSLILIDNINKSVNKTAKITALYVAVKQFKRVVICFAEAVKKA